MGTISTIISDIVKTIAEMGAGCASSGFCYEPKMPKTLRKISNYKRDENHIIDSHLFI